MSMSELERSLRAEFDGEAGLNIKPVITHTFPMKDFARGFELINSGQCGKVVLIP